MGFFKEVNFNATRGNAKRILNNYRRLKRIAGRDAINLKSPIMDDMPKAQRYGNSVEDAIIQHADSQDELKAIESALQALSMTSEQILRLYFCKADRYSNQAIAYEVGYSLRSIEDYKAQALMEFAEAYKHGVLIEYY